jgi:triosephosphate isomerase
VIVGHSERRNLFQETDTMVNQKIQMALKAGLRPIVCLGESFAEKEAGQTKKVIEEKLGACLEGLRSHELKKVIIAYEPIWAISTSPENPEGVSDTPESAQVIHKFIKRMVATLTDEHTAAAIPVVYGGSVKPDTVQGLAAMDDISGVLVGGASQEADSFKKIIESFTR